MTREVLLMRHAEAVPQPLDGNDFERPLTARGSELAIAAGARLASVYRPHMLLFSPARRTQQTAQLIATALQLDSEVQRAEPAIYLATAQRLLEILSACRDACACVMLIGHNPAVTQLAAALSSKQRARSMATAEWRHFSLPIGSWQELAGWRTPTAADQSG